MGSVACRLDRGMHVYDNIDSEGEFRAPVLEAQAGPAPPAPAAVAIAHAAPLVSGGVDGDLEDYQEPDGDLENVSEEDLEVHADVKDVVVGQETLVINTMLVSITPDQPANAKIRVVDQDVQVESLFQNQTSAIGTIASDQLEASEVKLLQAQTSTHSGSDKMFVATVGPFQMATTQPPKIVTSVLEAVQPPQTAAAKADGSKSAELNSSFTSDQSVAELGQNGR